MGQEQSGALAIRFDDGATIVAQPRPDDERRLADLLNDGTKAISLRFSDGDVEGHAAYSEVIVDVEGHAFALRVPSPADAAVLRRRLALGTLAATLAIAGAGAAIIGADVMSKSASAPEAGAPAARVAPGPAMDFQTRRELMNEKKLGSDSIGPSYASRSAPSETVKRGGAQE